MPKRRLSTIKKQISETRSTLKTLDRSLRRLASMVASEAKVSNPRRPQLSAKGRASLVLQGRYMGYMRQLNQKQKGKVRKIREKKGVRTAIVEAKNFLRP